MPARWERLYTNDTSSYIKDFIKRWRGEVVSPSDIKTLVDKYAEWDAVYSKFVRPYHRANFSCRVLRFIAQRMYCSHFQDGGYVEIVLRRMFEVHKCMETIERHMWCHWFSRFISFDNQEDFAQYFLEHGHRLPDIIKDPQRHALLRLMLRFGAMFSYGKNYSGIRDEEIRIPNYSLFPFIFKIQRRNPELLPTEVAGRRSIYVQDMYDNFVSCCKLILTDMSMSALEALHNGICTEPHNGFEICHHAKEDMVEFIRKFSANIVENFQNHFITPLSLKHICRLVIRRELNTNWALPQGIYQLPLPELLKIYLDI